MKTLALLGTTLGLSVTSGLNLYGTVFSTGLALHLGWLALPPELESLRVLSHPAILFLAGFCYLIEFVADKIPAVDHLWDILHTFIRPLGATILAWKAVGGGLPEVGELLILIAAGGICFATHAGKAGTRLAAAASGGHVFGMGVALSAAEDVFAILVAPLAIAHPYVTLAGVGVFLVGLVFIAPPGYRFLSSRFRSLRYALEHKLSDRNRDTLLRGHLPFKAAQAFAEAGVSLEGDTLLLPAYAAGLEAVPRWSSGFTAVEADRLVFVRVGLLRTRGSTLSWRAGSPSLIKGLWGYQLRVDTARRRVVVAFHPLTARMADRLRECLPSAAMRDRKTLSGIPRTSGE